MSNNQSHELFLREWEISVTPPRQLSLWANSTACDFAMVGVKSLYLLHGGALVAIPAFHEKFFNGSGSTEHIVTYAAIAYLAGIIFTLSLNIISYFSMCSCARAYGHDECATAAKLYVTTRGENELFNHAVIRSHEGEASKARIVFSRLRVWGIIFSFLSFLCFVCGTSLMIKPTLAVHGIVRVSKLSSQFDSVESTLMYTDFCLFCFSENPIEAGPLCRSRRTNI